MCTGLCESTVKRNPRLELSVGPAGRDALVLTLLLTLPPGRDALVLTLLLTLPRGVDTRVVARELAYELVWLGGACAAGDMSCSCS